MVKIKLVMNKVYYIKIIYRNKWVRRNFHQSYFFNIFLLDLVLILVL